MKSMLYSALEVTTGEDTLAKGNDTTCKLFIKGQINQGSITAVAALNEIENGQNNVIKNKIVIEK